MAKIVSLITVGEIKISIKTRISTVGLVLHRADFT